MLRTRHLDELPFETLVLLAKDDKGKIDQAKAKELIKVFRPERDGSLGKLEFVKSIDVIYKQLRLLSANITNSAQLDKAIESLLNIAFYIVIACYAIAALGQDPRAIFLSFSSVILGFTFMFGASASKYIEVRPAGFSKAFAGTFNRQHCNFCFLQGLLFILVQKPYGTYIRTCFSYFISRLRLFCSNKNKRYCFIVGVGDRIHLSNPQNETSPDGSSGWIVEKVTLTTTTVYWGTTNERATLSNGAISNLRVINAARSPNATIFVELKFEINTPYEKIAIFKTAVEQFMKDRPREWLTFLAFRPTVVEVDKGFIGYKVIAQHRNSWQGICWILESKSSLTTYCLEVAKQLDMRYHAPPLPVSLNMMGTGSEALQALDGSGGLDKRKIAAALRATSSRSLKSRHEALAESED